MLRYPTVSEYFSIYEGSQEERKRTSKKVVSKQTIAREEGAETKEYRKMHYEPPFFFDLFLPYLPVNEHDDKSK